MIGIVSFWETIDDRDVYMNWSFFGIAHCGDLGLLRPEAATVGSCRRQQHLWCHRNPYSRPEAAIFSCGRRTQDFLSHVSRQKSGRMVSLNILDSLIKRRLSQNIILFIHHEFTIQFLTVWPTTNLLRMNNSKAMPNFFGLLYTLKLSWIYFILFINK